MKNYVHTITILVTLTFYFTANASSPPILSTSVPGITVNVDQCNNLGIDSFYIYNTGGDTLTFHLTSLPSWLWSIIPSGLILPGDSILITFSFNQAGYLGGTYTDSVIIVSNDSVNQNYPFPVIMNVSIIPCAEFTFYRDGCSGQVEFNPISNIVANTYAWDFGDGTTSGTSQPSHIYTSSGTYSVFLIATNGSTSDTVTHSVSISLTSNVTPTPCYPVTLNYCCGVGIKTVHFSSGVVSGIGIDWQVGGTITGYEDFTCTDSVFIYIGYPYVLSMATGQTYWELARAWIDFNNDALFDPVGELVLADSARGLHVATITVNSSMVSPNLYGVPVRMRVASDHPSFGAPKPCVNLQYGQAYDFKVVFNLYNGINDPNSADYFEAFPNPSNGLTQIDYNLIVSSKVTLELFNIIGEKINSFCMDEIQASGKHNYQFDTDTKGLYIVKLTTNGISTIRKVVKM